jgi:NADH-quinone oxidoreductase subunit N
VNNLDYSLFFRAMQPESLLVEAALAVIVLDLTVLRRKDLRTRLNAASLIGALAAVFAALLALRNGAMGEVLNGVLNLDTIAVATRVGVLGLTVLVLGLGTGGRTQRHPAEYVVIVLCAAVGFMAMASAQQLLLVFLALELASLSLYVLAGFDKDRPESSEAALKYFLFGGTAAAFLLFGFSLLYGLTGTLDLPGMSVVMAASGFHPLLAVAMVMILVGFGYKAAAAPFHLWAPDAYQGAPAPAAAFIASASKLSGFVLFTRLLWGSASQGQMLGATPGWVPVVWLLAGASMLVGNLAALAQSNVRRLLAYSAIAHAGALLLGVVAAGRSGPAPLFYYLTTYGVATAGIFGVLHVLEPQGGAQKLTDLAGLYRRSPLLAACLMVFVLSLAGVPPLAGFFGKFAIFAAALSPAGLSSPTGWLAGFAIAMSAVGLYYYLLILKEALVRAPADNAPGVKVPAAAGLTLVVAAALTLLFGLLPDLLLRWF